MGATGVPCSIHAVSVGRLSAKVHQGGPFAVGKTFSVCL